MNEIYIMHIPPFQDVKLDEYIRLVSPENIPLLRKLMKGDRHTVDTAFHYMNRLACHVMFDGGSSAYDAEVILNLPKTSVKNWKDKYDLDLPNMKTK